MQVTRVLVFLGLVALACAQLNAGQAWQGTWNDGKRGFDGFLYICVDPTSGTANGAYSDAGVITGSLHGDTFKGSWFEAGYENSFGQFELTISGETFSGFWNYDGSSEQIEWTGTRSLATAPSRGQCLMGVPGSSVVGIYDQAVFCYASELSYQNTGLPLASASIGKFGNVQGFSSNGGSTVFLSDFWFTDDDDSNAARFRPENQADFGPTCTSDECADDDNDDDNVGDDDDDSVNTKRIVIGALIDNDTFCGGFWEGFYNTFIGHVCIDRTAFASHDHLCGATPFVNANPDNDDDDKATEILDIVQQAFDNLELPTVVIADDDGNDNTNSQTTLSTVALLSPGSPDVNDSSAAVRTVASAGVLAFVVAMALF